MQRPDAPQSDAAQPRPWLRRMCYLTILATFSLIAIGGHVTSTDVGLAVPDGFTTFGYPTLIAPLEVWWQDFGTRWEHSHRLKGNLVGMMSIVMAVWLLVAYRDRSKDRQGKTPLGRAYEIVHRLRLRLEGPRPYLRLAGVVMLLLVISQGVMGALRVSEISLTFAFIHGIVGQLILCGWVLIAAALSGPWLARWASIRKGERERGKQTPRLRWAVRVLLVLLLCQLTLGSGVRHFKADKAIPDFPLTYGQVLPPMFQDSLDERYIAFYTRQAEQAGQTVEPGEINNRYEVATAELDQVGQPIVTIGKLHLQLWHRLGAVVVCIVAMIVIIGALRKVGDTRIVAAPAVTMLTLLTAQFALGVITVATGTDPLMATLHQATGAALIAVATWLAVRIHLAEYPVIEPAAEPTLAPAPAAAPPRQARPAPATASA